MNLKRGLFRLWIVLTIAFTVAFIWSEFDHIKNEFEKENGAAFAYKEDNLLIPINRIEARGKDGEDYVYLGDDAPIDFEKPWYKHAVVWYTQPKFFQLYPENSGLSIKEISAKFYKKAHIKTNVAHPWKILLETVFFPLALMSIILIFGSSIFWACSGFKKL